MSLTDLSAVKLVRLGLVANVTWCKLLAFVDTTHDGDMLTVAMAWLVSALAVVTLFANKLFISDDVVVGVVMS